MAAGATTWSFFGFFFFFLSSRLLLSRPFAIVYPFYDLEPTADPCPLGLTEPAGRLAEP